MRDYSQIPIQGTTYCKAFLDATQTIMSVAINEITTTFEGSGVYSSQLGYSEMEVDVTGLAAKSQYSVFCYALDSEYPTQNSVTATNAVATQRFVRTLDTSPPVISSCAVVAKADTEDTVTATLELDEQGTAYCAAVFASYVAPSKHAVVAAAFASATTGLSPYTATIDVNKISAGYGASGLEPLRRGTDYDIYCWAQDEPPKDLRSRR